MLPWIFIHGNIPFLCRMMCLFPAFNVAMNFHSWKLLEFSKTLMHEYILQCCHEFSFMEIAVMGVYGVDPAKPSMLPWIFIRGNIPPESYPFPCYTPSMLPWIFIHGNAARRVHLLLDNNNLQCCHEFSFMEIIALLHFLACLYGPSMLPWIFIHGNCS